MRIYPVLGLLSLALFPASTATPVVKSTAQAQEDHSPRKRWIPETHRLHERKAPHVARRWELIERADPEAILPMRIGMKQSNVDRADEILADISDPKSPNYGKYLNFDEVVDLFAPSESSLSAVKDWLVSTGLVSARDIALSTNKQWLAFSSTVADAERLLFTDYHLYEHVSTGIRNVGCEEYHVPRNVSEHVDYITPGIRLMAHGYDGETMRKAKREQLARRGMGKRITDVLTAEGPSRLAMAIPNDEVVYQAIPPRVVPVFGCDLYSTVECVKAQYQIPQNNHSSPRAALGIYQGLGQHYSQEDLDLYFWNMYPAIPNGTHPKQNLVNGATGPATSQHLAGSEANLDFQVSYPLVWPNNPVLWQVDDEIYEINQTDPNTPYKGFFNNFWNAMDGSYCNFAAFGQRGNCKTDECRDPHYPNPNPEGWQGDLMCGVFEPSSVISMSYAGAEVDLPPSYHQRQCLELLKLGLRGVSVVVSSGDDGVAAFPGDPYPSGCLGDDGTVFNPMFLGSCPYVTAVGATLVVQDQKVSDGTGTLSPINGSNPVASANLRAQDAVYTETATKRFKSGGGFSNLFGRPWYQYTAVDNYLRNANLGFTGYYGGGYNYSSTTSDRGQFNKLGRAYPDLSAIGDNVPIWHKGQFVRFGGTSVSAPLFASVLAIINEERVAAGKSTIGFVNPVLYAHPEAFTDITTGNNANCGTSGFPATEGWDPVTGLGSPKFPKLLEVFMKLP